MESNFYLYEQVTIPTDTPVCMEAWLVEQTIRQWPYTSRCACYGPDMALRVRRSQVSLPNSSMLLPPAKAWSTFP